MDKFMNIRELAKKLAVEYKMPKADKYDLAYRDFDDMVEVIGFVNDPNYNMKDFEGREMLFPKRWITIGVLSSTTEVKL